MNKLDLKPEKEIVDAALSEIHYYSNLPRHIKGIANSLKDLKPSNISDSSLLPAHVVEGTTTVKSGKLNMPLISRSRQFKVNQSFTI